MRATSTLLALLLAGCATTAAPSPEPAPDLPIVATDPARVAGLGEPCPTAPARGERFCDAQGTVAGAVLPVDGFPGVPPAAATVVRQESGGVLTVALEGERLWIRRVTCPQCRRVLGWSFGGDLPRMPSEALGALQAKLGLPAEPLLRTAADWREAAARIPLPPAP